MDSDSEKLRKLLDWQKRVIETMYENAGGAAPYAYIWQKKWNELKRKAEAMQEEMQPEKWTVNVYQHRYDGRITLRLKDDTLSNDWELKGCGVIVEGEGLE